MNIGRYRFSPIAIVVALAFIGSSAFIAYAIIRVRDVTQIPMMSAGFFVLGIAFVAIAIGALVRLWGAASQARLGRAVGMAIGGGLMGMAAIGCFTAAIVLALLWKSS
ncbi:MAG TPA: hypothetical protein VKR30_05715 [Candidatus Limnocylindrales bacterium]|nr:hypothetical protein [Candidatus Limnocylindrales bacterium]